MTVQQGRSPHLPLKVIAWLWVGIPFAYGVYELIRKVIQLFTG